MPDAGISFSAPVVAGDYAEILSILPYKDILLAKALLVHNAIPFLDFDSMEDAEKPKDARGKDAASLD